MNGIPSFDQVGRAGTNPPFETGYAPPPRPPAQHEIHLADQVGVLNGACVDCLRFVKAAGVVLLTVDDNTIERAARALQKWYADEPWEAEPDDVKDMFKSDARIVLEAVSGV